MPPPLVTVPCPSCGALVQRVPGTGPRCWRCEARDSIASLPTSTLATIDAHLREHHELQALLAMRQATTISLVGAQELVAVRTAQLGIQPRPMPTFEELIEQAREATGPVRGVEAFWDGDTKGWMVCLALLVGDDEREVVLAGLREPRGDLRVFDAAVPPWPEAALARRAGEAIAEEHGVAFWFPAEAAPDLDAPRWRHRRRTS